MSNTHLPSGAVTETRTLSGRYRIVGHLARGGMGDVFEAEDLSLGRPVAIKILHPNFASDGAFTSRFRREAQAAANLSHPNIVGIYDFGEDGDTYYMVMELIEGKTLRDVARSEGPLLPRRAAEIVAEAAAALTVAHAAGVYHRDIKPGNIMLTPDGSVRVTDFGIARALDDSEELTRTGAVIGTATYFSPNRPRVCRPTSAATSTRSASSCTNYSPGSHRSRVRARSPWPISTSPSTPRHRAV